LLGAVHHDGRAGPAVADAARARRAPPGELLAEDELLLHAQAAATVFLRPRGGAPAALVQLLRPAAHELPELLLVASTPGAVEQPPLGGAVGELGGVLLIEEVPHHLAKLLFALAIPELHRGTS